MRASNYGLRWHHAVGEFATDEPLRFAAPFAFVAMSDAADNEDWCFQIAQHHQNGTRFWGRGIKIRNAGRGQVSSFDLPKLRHGGEVLAIPFGDPNQ